MKNKYEKPRKWSKLTEEFKLREYQPLEVYLLPFRVASEPYVRSFQHKVLNSILFSNELLYKIGCFKSKFFPLSRDSRNNKPCLV